MYINVMFQRKNRKNKIQLTNMHVTDDAVHESHQTQFYNQREGRRWNWENK